MTTPLLWPVPARHLEAGSLLEVARAALDQEVSLEAAKNRLERQLKAGAASEALVLGTRASFLLVAAEARISRRSKPPKICCTRPLSARPTMGDCGRRWEWPCCGWPMPGPRR
ncbi:hypothetical protein [Elstera litoralis]|uniref:hypothetical protein n=1 Tax=Elstera litoralis TaxID=552518 RepID=UPI0018DB0DCC|nr:hypothetical protein [Elstera litoralis]